MNFYLNFYLVDSFINTGTIHAMDDCAQVVDLIKCKTDSRQLEKYHQYVDEMESVTRLLLLLAGRLARLDNSTGHSLLATQVFCLFRHSL